jgi:hypothetical protein
MISIRVVAIPTEVAEAVLATNKDLQYGFPAYTTTIKDAAPCRHCLQRIGAGERAVLFTYDAFSGQERLPLPGPVYIHAEPCPRYPEDGGYPAALYSRRTLNAYTRGRRLVAQDYADVKDVQAKLEGLFSRKEVDYIHVRSTDAGCYTFRIERA